GGAPGASGASPRLRATARTSRVVRVGGFGGARALELRRWDQARTDALAYRVTRCASGRCPSGISAACWSLPADRPWYWSWALSCALHLGVFFAGGSKPPATETKPSGL